MTDTHVSNEDVAEVLGWTHWYDNFWYPLPQEHSRELPCWTTDLQLVHDDLESRLTEEEWREYAFALVCDTRVFGGGYDFEDDHCSVDGNSVYKVINATAQQKCDAFARVKARGG